MAANLEVGKVIVKEEAVLEKFDGEISDGVLAERMYLTDGVITKHEVFEDGEVVSVTLFENGNPIEGGGEIDGSN